MGKTWSLFGCCIKVSKSNECSAQQSRLWFSSIVTICLYLAFFPPKALLLDYVEMRLGILVLPLKSATSFIEAFGRVQNYCRRRAVFQRELSDLYSSSFAFSMIQHLVGNVSEKT